MWIDVIYVVSSTVVGLLDFKKGLIKAIFSIIAILFGFYMAILLHNQFIYIFSFLKFELLSKILAFVCIYLFFWFFIILIGWLVSGLVRKVFLGWFDKLLGLLFGLAKVTLLFCIIIFLFFYFSPHLTNNIISNSFFSKILFLPLINILIKFLPPNFIPFSQIQI